MSYIANYAHLIWSTANREPTINPEWEPRLFAYIGGTLQKERAKLLAAGGIEDHIHVLVSLPATLSYADAASVIKSNSSRFIHDELQHRSFDWQKGYAGFSVSVSMLEMVANYIRNQKDHHRKKGFSEEYIDFLERHQIAYDERYVFL
jgi:REP element-mobilizing transposase RayT